MAVSTDFTDQEIQSHINTHNTSVAVLCNMCIPFMEKGSHIKNVASQYAFDMSVYSGYVRRMQFFSKFYPHKMIMKIWVNSIKKYIE